MEAVTNPETGVRYYLTPEGKKYPSITTVIGDSKKADIGKWQKRVGLETAEEIRHQAAGRGTDIHLAMEHYINNDHEFIAKLPSLDYHTFCQLKPIIDANLSLVLAQEVPLYSDFLETAGRTDLIGMWKGKRAVIDFKTSRKIKKEAYVEGYFQQGAGYAVMFEERTGIPINLIVIVIAVDHQEPQVFEVSRDDHIHNFMRLRKDYKDKYDF